MTKREYVAVSAVAMLFGLAGGLAGGYLARSPRDEAGNRPENPTSATQPPAQPSATPPPDMGSPGNWRPRLLANGETWRAHSGPPPTTGASDASPGPAASPPASRGSGPPLQIKIATLAPEGTLLIDILRQMDRELGERTGGAVQLKLYPGGQMGGENDALRKISLGQLQGGVFTGAGLGRVLPAVRALELPFFFRNYEESDAAWSAIEGQIAEMISDAGLVLLGRADQGVLHVFSTRPIAAVGDLKESRIAALERDVVSLLLAQAVGARALVISGADLRNWLPTGAEDTVAAPPDLVLSAGWSRQLSHTFDFPQTNGAGFMVMTELSFEAIPPEFRPVVLDITRRYGQRFVATSRKEAVDAIEKLFRQGLEMIGLTDDARKEFERVGEEIREKMPGALYVEPEKQQVVRELIAAEVKAVGALRTARTQASPGS